MLIPLIELLEEVIDFLDNYSDVIDGEDGHPLPNKAMSLIGRCKEVLREVQPYQ